MRTALAFFGQAPAGVAQRIKTATVDTTAVTIKVVNRQSYGYGGNECFFFGIEAVVLDTPR